MSVVNFNKLVNSLFFLFLVLFQCGFRKSYSTQHCLLAIPKKWRAAVDKGESFGALLIYFCDIFLIIKAADFARYVDDNSPYTKDDTLDDVIETLDATS